MKVEETVNEGPRVNVKCKSSDKTCDDNDSSWFSDISFGSEVFWCRPKYKLAFVLILRQKHWPNTKPTISLPSTVYYVLFPVVGGREEGIAVNKYVTSWTLSIEAIITIVFTGGGFFYPLPYHLYSLTTESKYSQAREGELENTWHAYTDSGMLAWHYLTLSYNSMHQYHYASKMFFRSITLYMH